MGSKVFNDILKKQDVSVLKILKELETEVNELQSNLQSIGIQRDCEVSLKPVGEGYFANDYAIRFGRDTFYVQESMDKDGNLKVTHQSDGDVFTFEDLQAIEESDNGFIERAARSFAMDEEEYIQSVRDGVFRHQATTHGGIGETMNTDELLQEIGSSLQRSFTKEEKLVVLNSSSRGELALEN